MTTLPLYVHKEQTMLLIRSVLASLLFAFALPAIAQVADADLRRQMSEEEFKAAGLDKLSATELQRLNDWLNRKVASEVATETAKVTAESAKVIEKAKEEGRQEVVTKNRGFFDFGSSEPIVSKMIGEFRGFAKGQEYTLENGQVWRQVDAASLAGVRKTNPDVSIKPGVLGAWYMKIKGYNTAASVQRVK